MNILMREKQYDVAERYIKKVVKEYPQNFTYAIDLGLVYSVLDDARAVNSYNLVIDQVTTDVTNESNINKIRILAQTFYAKNLRNYTLETYKVARTKLLRPIYLLLNWLMYIEC